MIHKNRKSKSLGSKVILRVTFPPDIWPSWVPSHLSNMWSVFKYLQVSNPSHILPPTIVRCSITDWHFSLLKDKDKTERKHWSSSQNTAMPFKKITFLWPLIQGQERALTQAKQDKSRTLFLLLVFILSSASPLSPGSLCFLSFLQVEWNDWLSSHCDLISSDDQIQTGHMAERFHGRGCSKYIRKWIRVSSWMRQLYGFVLCRKLLGASKSFQCVSRWQHRSHLYSIFVHKWVKHCIKTNMPTPHSSQADPKYYK